MLVAEVCLLEAVRNKLIADLGLKLGQCEVELDNQVPAITAQDYYAITAGGIRPGPRHKSSGGVFDVEISVRVTLYRRVAEVARDRRRNVFMDLMKGTSVQLERVIRSLDYSYDLTTAALVLMQAVIDDGGHPGVVANAGGRWPEPFRTFSPDTSSRMVTSDYDPAQMAGAPADPIVAISRGVLFSGARYMQVRT